MNHVGINIEITSSLVDDGLDLLETEPTVRSGIIACEEEFLFDDFGSFNEFTRKIEWLVEEEEMQIYFFLLRFSLITSF